jgi:hypothetical protein
VIKVQEGLPCGSAIVESTNTIQKAEFVYCKCFESLYELQAERLGVVVQLRADALKAKLDEPGQVQGRVPHDSVQIDVANPKGNLAHAWTLKEDLQGRLERGGCAAPG